MALLPAVANKYQLYVASLVLVYALTISGLVVLIGWTGQVSFGHSAFFAIGAYVSAILMKQGVNWVPATLIAVAASAVLGLVMGLPAVRLRGFYLGLATFAFALLTVEVLRAATPVTGGTIGYAVLPLVFGPVSTPDGLYFLSLLTAAGVFFSLSRIEMSHLGRCFKAVRDIEIATGSLGISARRYKLMAFSMSAALAAMGGAIFAQLVTYLNPGSFGAELLLQFLVMVFVGGAASLRGAVIGAVFFIGLRQALQDLGSLQTLVFGGLLVLTMRFLPDGLGSLTLARLVAAVRPAHPVRVATIPALITLPFVAQATAGSRAEVLILKDVKVRFGGNEVLKGIDLQICAGFNGLIGPNGAGKTTVFNVVSGYVRPTSGAVQFRGRSLQGLDRVAIARSGIGRTFQTPKIVKDLTVLENVALGLDGHGVSSGPSRWSGLRAAEHERIDRARALLVSFGLEQSASRRADALPLATQKLVELVRALAAEPSLVLLDEPAAGMAAADVEALLGPLAEYASRRQLAVLIIEHDLALIQRLCEQVFVLDFGRIVASGTPREVLALPSVIKAYLGVRFASVGA